MRTIQPRGPRGSVGGVLSDRRPGLIESRCAQLGIDYHVQDPAPLGQRRRVLKRLYAA